jgi:hypothetical protein
MTRGDYYIKVAEEVKRICALWECTPGDVIVDPMVTGGFYMTHSLWLEREALGKHQGEPAPVFIKFYRDTYTISR